MRKLLAALLISTGAALPAAAADVRVNIGINVPTYPVLQRIPNYPVYYAPSLRANYFFYDGLYWVFRDGDWYASSWYNGPWYLVDRYDVPAYLLRVPVRYYRYAPATFRYWRADAAPRWNVYWGDTWASRRSGWDRYDIRRAPAAAPLPVYQRSYARDRYPAVEQQAVITSRNYRYQPREAIARDVVQERRAAVSRDVVQERRAAVRRDREVVAQARGVERDERGMPEQAQGRARGHDRDERGMPEQAQGRARGHDRDERGIPAHAQGKARGHDRDDDGDRGHGHGRGRGHDKD